MRPKGYLKLCTISLLLLATMQPNTADANTNKFNVKLALGVDRQQHLSANNRLDGILLVVDKDISQFWQLQAKARYLTESVINSDFTFQQQLIRINYQSQCDFILCWSASAGVIHQSLKQQAHQFSSKQSDTGFIVGFNTGFQFRKHQFDVAFDYQDVFDTTRYYLRPNYQYQLSTKWHIQAQLSLGYNNKFEHDINEYQLVIGYQF